MAPQKKKHTANQISGLMSVHQLKECPSCKETQSKVKDSRRVFDGVRRRYVCLSCNYKHTTYEIDSHTYEELRSLRSKFLHLQQLFNSASQPVQEPVQNPVQKKAASSDLAETSVEIPCFDCVHLTKFGCSFDIPEAQTPEAAGCNLFQPIISDNMLT